MTPDNFQYLSMLSNPGALAFLFGLGIVTVSLIVRRMKRRAIRDDRGRYCAPAVVTYNKK